MLVISRGSKLPWQIWMAAMTLGNWLLRDGPFWCCCPLVAKHQHLLVFCEYLFKSILASILAWQNPKSTAIHFFQVSTQSLAICMALLSLVDLSTANNRLQSLTYLLSSLTATFWSLRGHSWLLILFQRADKSYCFLHRRLHEPRCFPVSHSAERSNLFRRKRHSNMSEH